MTDSDYLFGFVTQPALLHRGVARHPGLNLRSGCFAVLLHGPGGSAGFFPIQLADLIMPLVNLVRRY
ncbi:hypothetical protein [Izhakiella capsodis]|uniref:hypothetical protein n=1 Tax=Izhakiella capsodis TaxID=1367852 RepID=UPI001E635FDF|nr:hypothetical protein [Izhakiella capsodis]